MFPQFEDQISREWQKLTIEALAHVFMNAAGRLNGQISLAEKPLATHVKLWVDCRRLENDSQSLSDACDEIFRRRQQDSAIEENPFVKPILEALNAASIGENSTVNEAAEAVRNTQIPPADVKKSEIRLMF